MKYNCEFCNVEYFDKSTYNRHLKSKKHIANEQGVAKPTNRKTYQCTVCPYSSKDCANYKRHMETHTERVIEYNFKCTLCNEIFKTQAGLEKHMSLKKVNHTTPITLETLQDDRPIHYKCTKCNKIYPTEQLYFKHSHELENDPNSIPFSNDFIIKEGLYHDDGKFKFFVRRDNKASQYKLTGKFEKVLPARNGQIIKKKKSVEPVEEEKEEEVEVEVKEDPEILKKKCISKANRIKKFAKENELDIYKEIEDYTPFMIDWALSNVFEDDDNDYENIEFRFQKLEDFENYLCM